MAASTVAEVAGADIWCSEVSHEFENRLRQMQEQYGARSTAGAAGLGLLNQALDASIARRLVDAHARDLQLTAADDAVAEPIRGSSFQGSGRVRARAIPTCSCAASA